MDRDTIIRLAREAGLLPHPENIVYQDPMFEGRIKTFAARGAVAERKAAWEAVNALIIPGDIGGDGVDPTAQRNGIVLAANALMSRIDAIRAGGKE
jgi:hypothetical protein